MVRSGDQSMSTCRDSMPAFQANRHSEVIMTHRRGVQDGEALAEQASLDDEFVLIELESEPVQQEAPTDSWFDGIKQVPRVGTLLPTSLEPTIGSPTGAVSPQTNAASPESYNRELARLRTQQRFLLALLVSFLGASAAFYAGSIGPEALRQRQLIAQLQNTIQQQHAQNQQQWSGLTSRMSILDARFSELDSRVNVDRPAATSSPVQAHVTSAEGTTGTAVPSKAIKPHAAPALLGKPTSPADSKSARSLAETSLTESPEAPSVPSATPQPSASPSPDAPPAPAQTESTARPSLREAMRAVAVRDSKRPPSPPLVPAQVEKAEPLKFASKCDRADPLCGDLD